MAFHKTYRGLQKCACGHQPTAHMAEFRQNGWDIGRCSKCQCTEYSRSHEETRCKGHVVVSGNDIPVFSDCDIIIVHTQESIQIQSILSLSRMSAPVSSARNN